MKQEDMNIAEIETETRATDLQIFVFFKWFKVIAKLIRHLGMLQGWHYICPVPRNLFHERY